MKLIKGQRIKLNQLKINEKFKVKVELNYPKNKFDIDICCFGVNEENKISDDRYFIFYNQLNSPNNAIKKLEKEDTFFIDLSMLPSSIKKLTFCLSIDGNGNVKDISNFNMYFFNENTKVCEFDFNKQNFNIEKSLILAEIYIKDNLWRTNIVIGGFNGGLDKILEAYGGKETDEYNPDTNSSESDLKENNSFCNAYDSYIDKKNSLKSLISENNFQLLELINKASSIIEENNLYKIDAKISIILDRSGSMYSNYIYGNVQKIIEKILPISLLIDNDKVLDTWTFADKPMHLSNITLDNINDFLSIENSGWNSWDIGSANNEELIIDTLIDTYKDSNIPVYIFFISDDNIYKIDKITNLLSKNTNLPIFWQFIDIDIDLGEYEIFKQTNSIDITGTNYNFFEIIDMDSISDENFYKNILNKIPSWLSNNFNY